MDSNQREFVHIDSGKNLIANNISYPKHPKETKEIRERVKATLEGAMLIYLLAMWESHVPKEIHEWLTEDEKDELNAFKHVRDCAAHGYKGKRAKKHQKKVKAFESKMPFSGISWDKQSDTINLSESTVARDLQGYLNTLTEALLQRFYKNTKPTS